MTEESPPPDPNPTVSATSPSNSFRSITIDVRVTGSNFQPGSRAVWRRNGSVDTAYATTRVKTNSTTFTSSSELLVSTTIEPDARLGRYDVLVVGPDGKVGVGTEKFELRLDIQQIDLGAGDVSEALGVNSLGQIVGTRMVGGAQRAFLWQNGTFTDLGVLPGMTHSVATDINESGTVAGHSGLGPAETAAVQRSFVWSSAGGMQALSSLGGPVSFAMAMNDNGIVTGVSDLANGQGRHAVVWQNGVIADIQSPGDAAVASPWDINIHGEIVGRYNSRSFRWTLAGGIQAVPMTGSNSSALDHAMGIDDAGQIVGWRRLTGGAAREAYLWNAGVSRNLLSEGGQEGVAWAINNRGQVVGAATVGGQTVAFLWTELDGATFFGAGIGANALAAGISESGWVVGIRADRATLWKVK